MTAVVTRGRGPGSAEKAQMQAGVRAWLLRTVRGGAQGLHDRSPTALLSLVCASALAPLVAAGVGVGGAVVVAGVGVLSSVGSGVLGEVVTGAIDRLHARGGQEALSADALEAVIARQLEPMLAGQDAAARELRGQLAEILEKIDAGGTMLRAAIESGDEQFRGDVIAVLGTLSGGFAELHFLLTDVRQSAADIQKRLDEQAADVRVIIEQNARQSTEIRLARAELATIGRRASTGKDSAPSADGSRWSDGSPYRGLLPFGENDARVFYGRERVTADLAVMVSHQATRGGVMVVSGASGAGKSSLLRAGLMPVLAQGMQVTGTADWPRIVITPTGDPLTELATHLAALGGSDARTVRDGLASHPDQAHLAVRQALLADSRRDSQVTGEATARLVMIVDQFEQVFTLSPGVAGEANRRSFIVALNAAASSPTGPASLPPAVVIIVVRGDFCDQCAEYPELAASLQNAQFVVGPMSEAEVRLTITGPAEAAGLSVDAGLPDLILGDLRARHRENVAGALPLLSQAMLLTWENREGDRLTSRGYGQAGGVTGAVQASADEVYGSLKPKQRLLAREIFQSMTLVSPDGRLTRRPVARADLYGALRGADPAESDQVLEVFAAKRLIVLDGGIVQIAHDVLLTAWPRLRSWLEDDQATWILHGQLAEDTSAWEERGRDASYLYRGAQLLALRQAAVLWASSPDRYPALTSNQDDFLAASNRAAALSLRWRRVLAVALVILFAGSLAGAGVAVAAARNAEHQRSLAEDQRNLAVSSQLAAKSLALDNADPVTAATLAAAAWRVAHTAQAFESMLQVFAQPERAVLPFGVAGRVQGVFSSDGKTLVTAGFEIQWWNAATHRAIGPPVTAFGGVYGIAFSPDGRMLATADDNGRAQLWDVRTHRQIGAAMTVPGTAYSVAFSPDGSMLATASDEGTVRLWNVHTQRPVGPSLIASTGRDPSVGAAYAVAFSPNGRILATAGGNGAVRLWNVQTHRQIGATMTVPRGAYAVAFSPDGSMLAAGGNDGTARLWNVRTQRPIGSPLIAGSELADQTVWGVAFSPDGRILATAGGDGTARLWNVVSQQQIGPVMTASVGGGAVSVAFSPDGTTLATGGFDSTVRLWNLAAFHQIGLPLQAGEELQTVTFRPDGKTLVTGGFYGAARPWNTATHRPIDPPLNGGANANFAVLSPDGSTEAIDASLNTVTVWNIADRSRIGRPMTPAPAANEMALSPDGRILAIGDENEQTQLWSVMASRPLGRLAGRGSGTGTDALVFSPDGRMLAVATGNGHIQLWDVVTQRRVGPLMQAGEPLDAMAFAPGGKILATAGSDGTVRLWDTARFRQIGLPMTAAQDVSSLAFSPNGRLLATADSDGTARLWDTSTYHQIGPALSATARGGLNGVAFSPNGDILATAGSDGTARLWDVAIPRHLLAAVCSIAGHSLTHAQWNAYAPTEPYMRVCP
jgi:WD40 repeat protein